MPACPFCQKDVKQFHRRSHLVPEWMYAGYYDKNHRILEVSRIEKKAFARQKGVYGSFICEDCERTTQLYDRYASLVLADRSPESGASKAVRKRYRREMYEGKLLEFAKWEGLDFGRFQ